MGDNLLVLIVTGIFAALVVIGFLWGIGRGLKKASVRLGTVAVCALLALLITPMFTNMVYTTIPIGGKTIEQLFASALDGLGNFEGAGALIEALPLALCNLIIFIVVFWVLKALGWVIYSIITRNYNAPNEDGSKPKKRRLLGGLVGMAQGIILFASFGMPVIGTLNVVNDTANKMQESFVDSEGNHIDLFKILSDMGTFPAEQLDNVKGMIKNFSGIIDPAAYGKTVPAYILKYTGMEWLFVTNGFNYLTTVKVNGKTVEVGQEVPKLCVTVAETAAPLADLIKLVGDFEEVAEKLNDPTFWEDGDAGEILKRVFNTLADNKTVADLVVGAVEDMLGDMLNDINDGVSVELKTGNSQEFLRNLGKICDKASEAFDAINSISEDATPEEIALLLNDVGLEVINALGNTMQITLPDKYVEMFEDEIFAELNAPMVNSLKKLFGI